jgi:hypothetical protein
MSETNLTPFLHQYAPLMTTHALLCSAAALFNLTKNQEIKTNYLFIKEFIINGTAHALLIHKELLNDGHSQKITRA